VKVNATLQLFNSIISDIFSHVETYVYPVKQQRGFHKEKTKKAGVKGNPFTPAQKKMR